MHMEKPNGKCRRSMKVRHSGGRRRGGRGRRAWEVVAKDRSFGGLANQNKVVGTNRAVSNLGYFSHLLNARRPFTVHPFTNARSRDASNDLSKPFRGDAIIRHVLGELHAQELPIMGKICNPKMGWDK